MYKLCFYVPEKNLEEVKTALFLAGAGDYGSYDQCAWQVKGEGQFRPKVGSSPHIGTLETVQKLPEYRVEMICKDALVNQVRETLIQVHPYEVPAYDFIKIYIP